jgi:hypothetical protein
MLFFVPLIAPLLLIKRLCLPVLDIHGYILTLISAKKNPFSCHCAEFVAIFVVLDSTLMLV